MLAASGLRKRFGPILAVDDVALESSPGRVLGVLGPNGAGKSTTIRMILNIIQPDAGVVTFDGRPFNEEVRNRIGYLPEERGLYRKNKLLHTILYFASLKGIGVAEAKRRAYAWLERFDLLTYHDRKVEELSKGNQQKVQFIIAILHDPSFLILDEPFSGLDPINQILLKDILLELKHQGKSIIFSTHQMDQAERLCDAICLINRGRVVLEGELQDVKRRFGRDAVVLEYEGDGSFLPGLGGVAAAHVYENYAELVLAPGTKAGLLLPELARRLEVRKFEMVQPSLNAIFLELVGGGGGTAADAPKGGQR
jgi:ABC-2 type transport system ATP-binding protein